MRYLVTGHPRTRSAWLSALLCAHGATCIHDARTYNVPLDADVGFSDPGIACLDPSAGVDYCQGGIVVITREDWREAFERWIEGRLEDDYAAMCDRNVDSVAGVATGNFLFEDLNDNAVVCEILKICGVDDPNLEVIDLWQRLRIEQHRQRAYEFSRSP